MELFLLLAKSHHSNTENLQGVLTSHGCPSIKDGYRAMAELPIGGKKRRNKEKRCTINK
jgi:hypothetical protein